MPVGRRAIRHLRRRSGSTSADGRKRPRADPSGRLGAAAERLERLLKDRQARRQSEFRVKRPTARFAGASARRRPASTAPAGSRGSAASRWTSPSARIAEERQALLAREVDHRAKNALALVQSIVRLTRASDIAAYTTAVEGRIRALSRAHTILSLSRWQGADMRGWSRRSWRLTGPAKPSRSRRSGRTCRCNRPRRNRWRWRCMSSSTNAAKYGALSSMSGRVKLDWELNPGTSGADSGRKAAARRRKRRRRRASARGSSPPASRASSPARRCSTGGRKGCNACCRSHATT